MHGFVLSRGKFLSVDIPGAVSKNQAGRFESR